MGTIFQPFTSFSLSVFKKKTCILHHFTFLDWSSPHIFLRPITRFLPLKSHFLTTISPLPAMCFIARKGVVYTICSGYLCFSPRIYQQNALRLAPKHLAFSTKTHCIQHQNAVRLAAFYTAFSTKTHCILLKMVQKWVSVAVGLNKNSFCLHAQLPPFGIKTNLRENRFFATRWAVVDKTATYNVKIYA